MKKIFQILKFSLLIAFVTMLITSCKSENQVKNEIRFEKLNAQERAQAYEEIKLEIVKNLVCVNFGQEIYDYQADVKRKELKIYSKYFYDYPHQFQLVKKFYGSSISSLLQNKGVSEYGDASIKNMEAPKIETLPCQEEIFTWNQKKNEWNNLKGVLPTEYAYEESWSNKLNKAFEWLIDIVGDILGALFFIAIFAYAFYLHYGLIVEKNYEGLWLLLVTPISAIPIQKMLKTLMPFATSVWERLLVTSLLLSFVFSVILFLYARSINKTKQDSDNE